MKVNGNTVTLLAYRRAWAGRVYEVWRVKYGSWIADLERAWTPLGDAWRVAGLPGTFSFDVVASTCIKPERIAWYARQGIEQKRYDSFDPSEGWAKPKRQPTELTPEGGMFVALEQV
jgi:hypothetical protein